MKNQHENVREKYYKTETLTHSKRKCKEMIFVVRFVSMHPPSSLQFFLLLAATTFVRFRRRVAIFNLELFLLLPIQSKMETHYANRKATVKEIRYSGLYVPERRAMTTTSAFGIIIRGRATFKSFHFSHFSYSHMQKIHRHTLSHMHTIRAQ